MIYKDSLNVVVKEGDSILFKDILDGGYKTRKGTIVSFFISRGIDYVAIRTVHNTVLNRRLSEVSKDI